METTQGFNDSLYVSAPTSPSSSSSLNSMQFYSAPTSPTRKTANGSLDYENEDLNSNFIEFEFETGKKFRLEGITFERRQSFGYPFGDQKQQEEEGLTRPTMAFADELFSNGQVMPLKPPLWLRSPSGVYQSSTASSPRSPGSGLRIPFPHRSKWNDEFDPFAVALENVKDEKRGKSHHTRARSLSPFRTTTPQWSGDSGGWNQHKHKQGGPLVPMQHQMGPNQNGLTESKGSSKDLLSPKSSVPPSQQTRNQMMRKNIEIQKFRGKIGWLGEHSHRGIESFWDRGSYERWYGGQNKVIDPQTDLSPVGPTKQEGLPFGSRVRPVKVVHEGTTIKPDSTTIPGLMEKNEEGKTEASGAETRKKRLKGYFVRYASFGRENKNEATLKEQISALWKRWIFKLKENGQSNTVKKVYGEPKMALTPYRPSLGLCLSFRMESRTNMYSP
ncbi:Estrogen receptor beta-1 like [Actinidia chinensis var. chinensis]|uniref:Estrogen receptor beta-1 like n=1 Tax=Actinidia chinensis var. chinensis TaxID=1590841 RepID=A0A2R6PFF8_ACTCC|nr:Estrogen receptor beta-1 like [Actinidia chinensis var. chinensis]